jgi:hypothetical protein
MQSALEMFAGFGPCLLTIDNRNIVGVYVLALIAFDLYFLQGIGSKPKAKKALQAWQKRTKSKLLTGFAVGIGGALMTYNMMDFRCSANVLHVLIVAALLHAAVYIGVYIALLDD